MIRLVNLSAVTKVERHDATSSVLDLINTFGGWVEDTQFFSNKMVTIRFVLPQGKIAGLIEMLESKHIHAELASPFVVQNAQAEQPGSIQLTFIHDEPDLVRPVPDIPGE